MKRQPLKPVSKKRAAANREYAKVREVYLRENPQCACCGGALATELHHICSGGSKAKSLVNTETIVPLCHDCHVSVQHYETNAQVRMKLEYVIKAINRLRGRSPNAITLEDLR